MAIHRGPEAVRAALVDAAMDLFADDGATSVRKVAKRAGVNHGLVHHYLGGKAGLRAAVLEHMRSAIYAEFDGPRGRERGSLRDLALEALRVSEADPRFVKILARALLDGECPEQLQTSFPVVERLREAAPDDPAAVRAGLAEGLALGFGMLVFGPWIRAALDLGPDELEGIRDAALERIFARLDPSPDAPSPDTQRP